MKGQTNAWVESIISGEKLYINLTTNQSNHSDLLGAVITIAFDDTIIEYIWDGNIIEYVIPTSKYYKVSFSAVEGYTTPEFFGGKAVNGNVYEVLGVYNTEMLTVNVNDVSGYEITTSKKVKVGSTIPERYTQLEYIESTGAQYIDTGFYPNHNTRIDIDFEAISTNNAGTENGLVLYGSGYAAENSAYECYAWNQQLEINYGNSNINFITSLTSGVKLRLSQNKSAVSVYNFSSESTTTYSLPEQTFKTPYPMALFGTKRNNNILGYQKVFGCQIYDDGVLIRDYVPAKDENNIAGLYDRVYNKFYPSASSTAFVAGPVEIYTQVEYIESTGTQYIDTNFKHNQDTRVVMMVQPTSITANAWLFEGRAGASAYNGVKGIFFYYSGGQKWNVDYSVSSNRKAIDGIAATDMLSIDYNKNVCTINGKSITHTATTFQSQYNLVLLACNTAGTIANGVKAKLYSCQVYDNNTLIRDYIPVKNSEGIAGLFDKVNNVFYPSASSTDFVAGEEAYETIAIQTTSTMSYKIPFGTEYIISASDIAGYNTPTSQTFIANQVHREVSMLYKEMQLGVYIQGVSGKLYTEDEWSNQETPNGIAVLSDKCSFVAALEAAYSTYCRWGPRGTLLENITTTTSMTVAQNDYSGKEQSLIINELGAAAEASQFCTSFIFPNGKYGYMGSAGEWQIAIDNHIKIESILQKLGIYWSGGIYWTSTQYDAYYAWLAHWDAKILREADKGTGGGWVLAFCNL